MSLHPLLGIPKGLARATYLGLKGSVVEIVNFARNAPRRVLETVRASPIAAWGSRKLGIRTMRMSDNEAEQILDFPINAEYTYADVCERVEVLAKGNDPEKGGSLYLKTKILEAGRILKDKVGGAGERREGRGSTPGSREGA